MNGALMLKCDKMLAVMEALMQKYRWRANDLSLRFSALVYSLSDSPFDIGKYDAAISVIKNNTGVFSYYRSTLLYPLAAQLICNFADPAASFSKLLEYDGRLRESGLAKNVYLGIAAYALLKTSPDDKADERIRKAVEIYKRMKKNHFWLTSSDDYPVAVLLASEEKSAEQLVDTMERHFEGLLKEGFGRSNGLQFLSHILTFGSAPVNEKVMLCRDIKDFLRENRLPVSSMFYGAVGLLALLGDETREALEQVVRTVEYLKSKKAFKWYNREFSTLMVCVLVGNEFIEARKLSADIGITAAGVSVEALIAAQTAAAIAASAAAASAAAASAST